MKAAFGTVRDAIRSLPRFALAYPWACAYAAAVYAAFAAATKYVTLFQPAHYSTAHLAVWLGALPQTLLLAPVWTSLPRFIILKEQDRRLFTFDYRLCRVTLVTLVLSAILMAGSMAYAATFDGVLLFTLRPLFARPLLLLTLVAQFITWWLVLRLAIAPAMAAAGTRGYALDTSLSFTHGWLGRIIGVRIIVHGPVSLLIGSMTLAAYVWPGLQRAFNQPPWVAAFTLATALTELADAAAMALVAVHIVRARQGEEVS